MHNGFPKTCCVVQGQILKVTVRLRVVGMEFDITDLKLDSSNVDIRELPLKIPSTAEKTAKAAGEALRYDMLVYNVRVLVRTVFMPETRTFNTYLSSMIAVRNNSPTSVMVRRDVTCNSSWLH